MERIYWAIEPSKLRGIVDKVRTILVELVAEMRAATPPGSAAPSSEAAQQAVSVAIYGKRSRVVVNQTVAGQGATVATSGSKASVSSGGEPETPQRRVMYWVAGAAGVVAAVAAVLTLWTT